MSLRLSNPTAGLVISLIAAMVLAAAIYTFGWYGQLPLFLLSVCCVALFHFLLHCLIVLAPGRTRLPQHAGISIQHRCGVSFSPAYSARVSPQFLPIST